MKKLALICLTAMSLSANSLTVDDQEIKDLTYMREEEKLAGDVYQTFYDKYKKTVFINIKNSEVTHTGAIKNLLTKYKIPDPASTTLGVFKNQELQSLFNTLVKDGSSSYIAALKVGAAIEEIDTIDIKNTIKRTDNPDIITTYTNLLNGSKSHLSSFVKNLANAGVVYTPQYLTQEEYNLIIK